MSLFTANLDDIVFEGRNQAYGAYQLRRDYGSNVASAGGITTGICGLLFVAWLAWPAARPQPVVLPTVTADPILPPATEVEKPKQARLAPRRATHRAAALPPAPTLPTQVVQDKLVSPPPVVVRTTVATVDGAAGPSSALPGNLDELGTPGGGPGDGEAAGPDTPATNEAFTFVEKMPEFAGGQAALLRYLHDHLRYPGQALRDQVEGRVFMSFVVRADGTIAEATVLKGLGAGLDEEALRVVRQMPAWTPGYQARHAVAVRFTLPISFKLQ